MGMMDWLELRWVRLPEPDGDYVRIGGKPHKLQYRTLECPPTIDVVEMKWGPWRDVPLSPKPLTHEQLRSITS